MLEVDKLFELQEIFERESTQGKILKNLIQAISDWPNEIDTLQDFIAYIKEFVGGDISRESLNKVLAQLNPKQHAWEIESISSLLDVLLIAQIDNIDLDIIEKLLLR